MNDDLWPFARGPGWRFLMASSSVAVLRVSAAGIVLACNRYVEKLTGMDLTGQPWSAMLIEFGPRVALEDWGRADPGPRLLNVCTAAGLPQTLEVTLETIGDEYLLIGEVDAADQARLSGELMELNHELNMLGRELALKNHDLIKAQCQLVESEKMTAIGQLAAGVAHEINNAVGFVKSNLGTSRRYMGEIQRVLQAYAGLEHELTDASRSRLARLKQEVELDYLQEDLDTLFAETLGGVQRIQGIVSDLRTFSQLDSTQDAHANLEQGLDSAIGLIGSERLNKIRIVKDYSGVPEVRGPPSELHQVFLNILLNAVEAIEPPGQITIRTGADTSEVWVEIEDTGKGIAPEHVSRVFEPFFTTKPVGQGVGLGLALSYGVVKRHRGRMSFSSEPGKGTRVRIALPAGD